MIYQGSTHGWTPADFHKLCDGLGPTITIMRSSKGKHFGGFTTIPWSSNNANYEDVESFIFSIDLKKSWKCDPSKFEITHNHDYGPVFGGNSLSLREAPFNKEEGGKCFVGVSEIAGYGVEEDGFGNSVLTGDGAQVPDG